MPSIDLLEGEGYPEKPIQCSAFGNPPPRYYWTFEPFIVTTSTGTLFDLHRNQSVVAIGSKLTLDKSMAKGRIIGEQSMLNLDSALSVETMSTTSPGQFHATRTLSGNYTCMATNQHGSASATLTINVFCKIFDF